MPQTIQVPGIGDLEFPDDMGDDQIAEAIDREFGQASGNSQPASFFKPGGEIDYDSPEFAKQVDKMQRDFEMQRAIGRGMESGTEFTGSIANSLYRAGMLPSNQRELSPEERVPGGMDPEKAALELEKIRLQDEAAAGNVYQLGAAAHTGLAKGSQLPNTVMHSLARLGRSLPGGQVAESLWKGVNRDVFGGALPDITKENDEYFDKLGKWEKWMSERDAMLGGGGFGTQVTEGAFRGFAELPVQLLSGLPARGAATAEGMIKGIGAGAGVTAGLQTFGQELSEGASMPTAAARAATSGLITGLTTRAFGTTGVESIFKAEGVKGVMNRIKHTLIEAGWEGAEEAVDQAQQELANWVNKNPDKPISDVLHDVLLAGGVGTLLGGAMGSVSAMQRGVAGQPQTQQQVDLSKIQPLPPEGGDQSASENQKAAAVHGDVRAQPEQGQGQVPAEEGGKGVQSEDPEVAYMRAEREGMDETNALLKDAIASQGATDHVVPQPGVAFDENSPFFGRIAWFTPSTGKINIDPMLLHEELKGIPKNKRKEKVDRILNEEMVHAFTDVNDARDFVSMSSRIEQALGRRIYSGNWKGRLPGVTKSGKPIHLSQTQLGFEMMRRRIQRIQKLTPTEMVGVALRERWKLETYDILDRAIGKAREYVGTTASREGRARQLEILDRTRAKLQQARAATIKAGITSDTDEIEDLGSLAKTEQVKKLLETIGQGGTFPNNSQAVDAGLQAESIDDLDAMAEAKRTIIERLQAARQNKDFGAMAGLVGPNQFLREAIEAATNAGSQRVDKRVTDAEKAKPHPKLDWRKNPEVKQWLQQNGQEVGVQIDESEPIGALARRRSKEEMAIDLSNPPSDPVKWVDWLRSNFDKARRIPDERGALDVGRQLLREINDRVSDETGGKYSSGVDRHLDNFLSEMADSGMTPEEMEAELNKDEFDQPPDGSFREYYKSRGLTDAQIDELWKRENEADRVESEHTLEAENLDMMDEDSKSLLDPGYADRAYLERDIWRWMQERKSKPDTGEAYQGELGIGALSRLSKEELEDYGVAVDKQPYSVEEKNELREQYATQNDQQTIWFEIREWLQELDSNDKAFLTGYVKDWDIQPVLVIDTYYAAKEKIAKGQELPEGQQRVYEMLRDHDAELTAWEQLIFPKTNDEHEKEKFRLANAFHKELLDLGVTDWRRPNYPVHPVNIIDNWKQYRAQAWKDHPELASIIDEKLYRTYYKPKAGADWETTDIEFDDFGNPITPEEPVQRLSPDEEMKDDLDAYYAEHGGPPQIRKPYKNKPGSVPAYDAGPDDFQLTAGALSKAAQKRIEALRKLRELEIGKQGRHPKVEEAGAAMSKRLADTPVTPESIDEIANEILGQKSVQTPRTTSEGGMKAKIKGAPSFQEFVNRVRTRHGTAIQEGQLKEAWEDAVWKKLENATGEELNAMVDNLGLRNKVFGQFVGGSTKGGDIHRIARTGEIADVGAAKQESGPLAKATKRAERLLDRAADLDAKAEIAKTEQEAAALRQRAQQLRIESENLSKLVESGQGMPQQESLFPAVESTQSTYTGMATVKPTEDEKLAAAMVGVRLPDVPQGMGKFKGAQREAAGGESPAVRARKRAISVIGQHLINERGSMKEGLNRKEITPDDVRWNEDGNEIYVAKKRDTDDLDKLGMELTRGAGSNAATKRVTGGGRVLQKVEALPRSATKRVVALLDNVTKKVHLVSAYRDGRKGPVFKDPFSVTGEHKPLSEMTRFRPLFSIPLDMPVQDFHQTFKSVKEFNERFYNQVHQTAKQVGWRGMETEPNIEGTPGLEGEGGLFQGPDADLARIAEGMSRGARDMGIDITEPEARAAYEAFSPVEVSTDAEHVIKRLAEKAKKNELKPKDWLLIQALTKINEAVLRDRAQDLADQKADAKKAGIPFEPNEVSAGMVEETLNRIYDLAKRNETQSSFVQSAKGKFAERLRTARPFGAAEAGPSQTSRELTMPSRRPPTDISQAEPGQAEVPTGADPNRPAGLQAEQEPRFRRRAPTAEPTKYGEVIPKPLQGIPKKVLRKGRIIDAMHQKRPEGGALIETGGRRAEPTSYPATGEPWIGEGPPPTTYYEVPPQKKAEIQRYINERMDAIEAKYEQMRAEQQQQQPQPEQTGMEFGEGTGERSVDLPRTESEQGDLPIGALRTRRPRSLNQMVSNTLSDFGSFYDKWMVDRLKDYGGPISRLAADGFNWIIDREKQLYGGLTPLLDRARRLAGGIEPNRSNTVGDYVRDLPRRARESINAQRAVRWLNGVREISPGAATARTVDAVEGRLPVPPWAQSLIDAVQAANMEIGLMLQPVVPGFRATGRFQRNFTSLGYDIIRDGAGEMWQAWTRGIARANYNRLTAPGTFNDFLNQVRADFTQMKQMLDDPITSGAALEQINQDLARRYPRAITHVRSRFGWQPVIHSDLFGYLENAARRATHVRAFREQFPNDQQGRQGFAQLMEALRRELPSEVQRDLDALVRSMHGHPTDDYSGGWQDYTRMGPQQTMGQAMRMANTTINNVLSKLVLTGQMFTQTPESLTGSTPIFLGYRQYMRAAARARQLYNVLETMGSVNRVMHDYTWNPNARVRSAFRLAGNVVSKFSAQNFLNEIQEAMAAATARVTTEDIQSGNMSDWQRRMLPDTFHKMGFTEPEIGRMMQGDPELLDMFQRRAAAFLTGGNKAIAEGSRLGANRLFNSIFRFQTYPMIKANQSRKVLTDLFDQTRTPQQRWRSAESAARFIAGNTLQGALTVALTSLAYGGMGGLKIKWEEAKDEPLKFLGDVFMASVSGPAYMVYQGLRQKGMMGIGEQAARAAFPYAIARELIDMGQGNGQYRDKDTFQKIGRFLSSKTPGTRFIGTALAAAGLGDESRPLDVAISALNRWRRDNLGYKDSEENLANDDRKEFRMNVKKAIESLKDGDMEGYQQAWMDAVMERGVDSVSESMNSLKVLVGPKGVPLDDDQKDALMKHIGVEAYERLEYYDLMLDRAADGIVLPPQ